MHCFTDQLGRTIRLQHYPKRIVSVVPSQTELLFDLGLENEVVGITKFCVHPDKWFRSKTRIGGTKQLNIEKIKELRPDLVIANVEENVKEQIEEIEKFCPVWISDVKTVPDALAMTRVVGELTGMKDQAHAIAAKIETSLPAKQEKLVPACYLIWRDPMMTAGGDTFISEMMALAGFRNVYNQLERYPELSEEEIRNSEAGVILLSSEPYPFKMTDQLEFQERFPNKKFMLVNGEMFSWYGSRMLKATTYFKNLTRLL